MSKTSIGVLELRTRILCEQVRARPGTRLEDVPRIPRLAMWRPETITSTLDACVASGVLVQDALGFLVALPDGGRR